MPISQRKIQRFGGSKAVILPADWFRSNNLTEKQSVIVGYGSIVLILSTNKIEKYFILKEVEYLLDQIKKYHKRGL